MRTLFGGFVFAGNSAGGGACVADEVGQADAAVGVAEEREAGVGGDAGAELGHAGEVADGVLGETLGPAADDRDIWFGQSAEDVRQIALREGGEFLIRAREESFGGVAAKEGAEQATVWRDAMVELLVDEGAGEQLVFGRGWDEEAEALRECEAACVEVSEGDHDGGTRFEIKQMDCCRIEGSQESLRDLRGDREEELVEDFGGTASVEVHLPALA